MTIHCPDGTKVIIEHLPEQDLWAVDQILPLKHAGYRAEEWRHVGCRESRRMAMRLAGVFLFHGRKAVTR